MIKKTKLIYDFKEHSLYYENRTGNIPMFSLMLDTLELQYGLQKGELLSASGFLPLVQAIRDNISIGTYKEGHICLKGMEKGQYQENFVYNIFEKMPETKEYFENKPIQYDPTKNIILLGTRENDRDSLVKVNAHILCGLDSESNIKCIYIFPDETRI